MHRQLGTITAVALLAAVTAACGRPTPAEPPVAAARLAPTTTTSNPPPPPPPAPELPLGGRTVFPKYRVVAYYGTAGAPALGVLGQGSPEQAADAVDQAARPFATPDRTVQPAMEFIATVADRSPGPDGSYSHDVAAAQVQRYLDAARRHHQMFILDIQPGHTDFLSAVQPWRSLLSQPDVGLALDAEWRMDAGQVPGTAIGHVDAGEVNQVLAWLADLTRGGNLPQKVVVLHMFRASMVTGLASVADHPELALVQHLDGFGGVPTKMGIYHAIAAPQRFHMGFKLFYTQDHPLLGPPDVLAMRPQPEFVSYQ
jgi:hypothetical protein